MTAVACSREGCDGRREDLAGIPVVVCPLIPDNMKPVIIPPGLGLVACPLLEAQP